MTRNYNIPNNLDDKAIAQYAKKYQTEWGSYVSIQEGDILVLDGSWGPYYYMYKNKRWIEFKFIH